MHFHTEQQKATGADTSFPFASIYSKRSTVQIVAESMRVGSLLHAHLALAVPRPRPHPLPLRNDLTLAIT